MDRFAGYTKKRSLIPQKRRDMRDYTGSPIWTFNNALMAANAMWIISLDVGVYKKYSPYDSVTLTNNSVQPITISINQGADAKVIPAGTILTIDRFGMRGFLITNTGVANIAAGELEVAVERKPIDFTSDVLRRKGFDV